MKYRKTVQKCMLKIFTWGPVKTKNTPQVGRFCLMEAAAAAYPNPPPHLFSIHFHNYFSFTSLFMDKIAYFSHNTQ